MLKEEFVPVVSQKAETIIYGVPPAAQPKHVLDGAPAGTYGEALIDLEVLMNHVHTQHDIPKDMLIGSIDKRFKL